MSPAARDKAHRLAAAYSALGYVAIEADDATGQGGAVVVASGEVLAWVGDNGQATLDVSLDGLATTSAA